MESIRLIKNEADYDRALALLDDVMDAKPGTEEFDRLELLTALVEMYEEANYPIEPPSAVEAIRFVMDQRGLTQKDLEPYIGSRSVVSQVLNGKRPLTLDMVRALHTHLEIPAESLLQDGQSRIPEQVEGLDWKRFPLAEMAARGLIEKGRNLKTRAEELVRNYFAEANAPLVLPEACLRQAERRNAKNDSFALQIWLVEVGRKAREVVNTLPVRGSQEVVDADLLRELITMSIFHDGPLKAKEFLASRGVILVIEPHFKRTYLDGAALLLENGAPVVALTMRYDRLDYFWFTLLHELAHHAKRHVTADCGYIIDDLEIRALEGIEKEADLLAQSSVIPDELWDVHPAKETGKLSDVKELAGQCGVHPAIVAGRVRREKNNYRILSQHVGAGEVRKYFF